MHVLTERIPKRTIIYVILLCMAAAIYFTATVTEVGEEERTLNVLPESISLQIKNVHFTEVSDTGIVWEISADTARLLKEENISLFNNMTVKLTNIDGTEYRMTADEGSLKTDTRDIELAGSVIMVSDRGERFETDHLEYQHEHKRVFTDGEVLIMTPWIRITGSGMSLLVKEKHYSLLSGVRAEIRGIELFNESS